MAEAKLRIGVDVGGTNTDGVILDPCGRASAEKGILAWHKAPTTGDPSNGIQTVISALLHKASVEAKNIASVTIGTTAFINALVEMDQARLAKVAILRLCGPFSRSVPPGLDWPQNLRKLICAHHAFLSGGLEVDGNPIGEIDEAEIRRECAVVQEKGIKSIVINGIFSPADIVENQEERVRAIVARCLPDADIVLSKEVANIGFVERENAAILNAAILAFARTTMRAFQRAMRRARLRCPVFVTQNDGTVLPAPAAARLPIRTFASGPTNSMCGAAFLVDNREAEAMLVVDIGGTTTDVGLLQPNGFPRQAAAVQDIAGVRMNFSCPDVKSIGLGGGSRVRIHEDGSVAVGPDSVGHRIDREALVFGGDVPTATDYTVAARQLRDVGERSRVDGQLDAHVPGFAAAVAAMLERLVDTMKTSPADIPVVLVGGGAIIAPDRLKGASRVIKPEFAGVANAIGAAIARVSGTVDTIASTAEQTSKQVLHEVAERAIARAVQNGAQRASVRIAEMDAIPLQYIANKTRFIVKAVGDFDFAQSVRGEQATAGENDGGGDDDDDDDDDDEEEAGDEVPEKNPLPPSADEQLDAPPDVAAYRPTVQGREWIVSQLDLAWIAVGAYILGTGGGGTPYPHYVRLREMMRNGAVVRVVNPYDLADDAVVACGGGKGSPTVSVEKLPGDEMMEAQQMVYDYVQAKPDAVIALEIGGGNGMQGFLLGASCNMNIPTVDGDWMGRAYPVAWQVTPVVYETAPQFLPTAIADGNGNTMLMLKATSEKQIERAFRAALSEMGSHVGCAKGPYSGLKTKKYVVEHTVSLAWRIGRAVALCRQRNDMDHVAEHIIGEVGGRDAARVLFKGKIVGVERRLVRGHVYGEVRIEAADVAGRAGTGAFAGAMKIPFKNENLVAVVESPAGVETTVATVPDLICVLDAQNGEAIGTPDYRYGLLVVVVGITASERWTSTARGLEIGGPKAFDMDYEYRPLGVFKKPVSVIDEYGSHS